MNGAANASFAFFLPDAANQNVDNILLPSPPSDRVDYPLPEPITVRSIATLLTNTVPPGAVVVFRIWQNGAILISIPYLAGGNFMPQVDNLALLPFSAGDRIALQIELINFPTGLDPTIATAVLGYV